MAKSEHVGFRANIHTDKDILDDLARFKDRTARLKDVYRKVMAWEALASRPDVSHLMQQPPQPPQTTAHVGLVHHEPNLPKPSEPLTWAVPTKEEKGPIDWSKNFPHQAESTANEQSSEVSQVKKNILGSF